MARAARYGHIQPSEYEALHYREGPYLADLCHRLAIEDWELDQQASNARTEAHMKITAQAAGARIL